MGKFLYDPQMKQQMEVEEKEEILEEGYTSLIHNIDSVRPVGDTDCEYVVYLEDYVYTYLYQFAAIDLTVEHAGVLVGEFYPESKEMIICGMFPVDKPMLNDREEWINVEAVQKVEVEKEKYFPGTQILGWFHMQPGYGTMLTMKEVKVHRDLFDREGSMMLLIDPINKIETFYIYEDATLKEQTGYYLYYDKNPYMQKYMLENPFITYEKEDADDTVVSQFRELGRKRKVEYTKRKQTNTVVIVACVALLALAAVLTRVSDQNSKIRDLQDNLNQMASAGQTPAVDSANKEEVKFIIEPREEVAVGEAVEEEATVEANSETVEVTEEAAETVVEEAVVEDVVKEENTTPAVENVPEEVVEVEEAVALENTPAAELDYQTYEVQPGDTLRSISVKHYNTESRAKEIIKINNIDNGDHIFVGQKLKLMPQ